MLSCVFWCVSRLVIYTGARLIALSRLPRFELESCRRVWSRALRSLSSTFVPSLLTVSIVADMVRIIKRILVQFRHWHVDVPSIVISHHSTRCIVRKSR
jgi:hypothetical protein